MFLVVPRDQNDEAARKKLRHFEGYSRGHL